MVGGPDRAAGELFGRRAPFSRMGRLDAYPPEVAAPRTDRMPGKVSWKVREREQ